MVDQAWRRVATIYMRDDRVDELMNNDHTDERADCIDERRARIFELARATKAGNRAVRAMKGVCGRG